MQRAEAEAAQHGITDYDWIVNRTTELAVADTERRILGMIGPHLAPMVMDREAQAIAGTNAHALEYAKKMVGKGLDTSDPEVAEMIRRASENYATEKTPAQVSLSVETGGQPAPNTVSGSLRQDADAMARMAAEVLGYSAEQMAALRLTDAELMELAS